MHCTLYRASQACSRSQGHANSVWLSFVATYVAQARDLLRTVQPFDARMFKTHRSIAPGARRGLEVLEECARLLLQELRLEGYALGLSVKVQVRADLGLPGSGGLYCQKLAGWYRRE